MILIYITINISKAAWDFHEWFVAKDTRIDMVAIFIFLITLRPLGPNGYKWPNPWYDK